MTDKTKTPAENEAPTASKAPVVASNNEAAPASEEKPDEAPPVAGEPEAAPQPVDPTVLGALTPQEVAVLGNLQRRTQQLTLELGNLELQKDEMKDQIRAAKEQSHGILAQVGQRLAIPNEVSWAVGGDGLARMIPQQFLQAMQQGRMPQGRMPQPQQPPAATVSQPSPSGEAAAEQEPPKEE